ncbi:MAG: hypothetical protein KTR24_11115 [Saprospiraceae bacterium]|nr:hypothetical protein [Saprospiraceae bacterium]
MKNLLCGVGIVGCLMLSSASCTEVACGGSASSFQNQFENFIEKVDELDYESDDKRWKAFDKRFRLFIDECYPAYEEEMTKSERSKFWMGTLSYYSDRYGDEIAEAFAEQGEIISEEVVENLEAVFEETGRKLEDFLERNEGQIESLFEEIGRDIESWADRLQEILEE